MRVDKITKSLDSGDIVIGVFLLKKKGFDTVNHKIPLRKMFAYGIRGNIQKWFDSYHRSQFIMYDTIQSETRSIKCGGPQGSILRPITFYYLHE